MIPAVVELYRGVNSLTGKPVQIDYLPNEEVIRISTFYADTPYSMDKPYIFTVNESCQVTYQACRVYFQRVFEESGCPILSRRKSRFRSGFVSYDRHPFQLIDHIPNHIEGRLPAIGICHDDQPVGRCLEGRYYGRKRARHQTGSQ